MCLKPSPVLCGRWGVNKGATFLPWQLADIQEEGSRAEASVSVQTASWGVLNL